MKIGDADIDNIYVGDTRAYKSYKDNKLVYPSIVHISGIELGINAHPATQGSYYNRGPLNFEVQIAAMVAMGIGWVRIDLNAGADGAISNISPHYYWGRLFGTSVADIGNPSYTDGREKNFGYYHKCIAAGIKVLFILDVEAGGNDAEDNQWTALYLTPEDAYNASLTRTTNFMNLYGEYMTYMEHGNELELSTRMLVSGMTGTHLSHYKAEKLSRCIEYVAGMEDGVKAVKPSVITTFDIAGWLATYLLTSVLDRSPTINKVSWHWYSDFQDRIKGSNLDNRLPGDGKTPASNSYTSIYDYIANRYPDKQIWFTEFGHRWKFEQTIQDNEHKQLTNYNSIITDYIASTNTEVMFYHELIDIDSTSESQEYNYGIFAYLNSIPRKKALEEALENRPI